MLQIKNLILGTSAVKSDADSYVCQLNNNLKEGLRAERNGRNFLTRVFARVAVPLLRNENAHQHN